MENETTGFHDLWSRYAKDIQRFAYYLSGDAALAEDVMAETFLRAWTTRDRLRLSTVKAYLLVIARNLVFQELRGRKRQVALEDGLPVKEGIGHGMEAQQELLRVRAALARLPELDRSALLMRADQMPYGEIAEVLGIPIATVRVRVHHARLKLAESKTRSLI